MKPHANNGQQWRYIGKLTYNFFIYPSPYYNISETKDNFIIISLSITITTFEQPKIKPPLLIQHFEKQIERHLLNPQLEIKETYSSLRTDLVA